MSEDHGEDRMDGRLRAAVDGYNRPPAPPREAMWARIEAERRVRRSQDGPGRRGGRRRGLPGWTPWAVGLAAMLALGVGLGRLTMSRSAAGTGRLASASSGVGGVGAGAASRRGGGGVGRRQALYRLAAAQTFGQAEALLTALKTDPPRDTADTRRLTGWARDVLSSTRLLMDSPAGRDPKVSHLLGDLELILVQIVQLSPEHDSPAARRLIDDAVKQRDVLPRIRSAVPAGAIAAGA